jgi:uncharacterized membrane protein (DUF106 family)
MSWLDPMLGPLLDINPFLAVFLVSFLLSILITIIYKLMTDQELMKTLKEDMKAAQKEMKLLKDNPAKLIEHQKKAMEKNMKYMMHSMKPTLITFIPIILIFGWLNANFAYEPILPGEEFDVLITLNSGVYGHIEAFPPRVNNSIVLIETSAVKEINSKTVSYKFKGLSEGEWDVVFKVNNETDYVKSVRIDEQKYASPIEKRFEGKDVKEIKVGYQKKIVLDIFGWKMGWLATYIILSIIFSMSLRKLLKLH